MCRGLAIGFNVETKKMICTGKSSHTETLGSQEDSCIKFEIIVDDRSKNGYFIELDEQYSVKGKLDSLVQNKFKKYLSKLGTRKNIEDILETWRKRNDKKILRYLLTLRSHARSKGSTSNRYQKTGGDTYNSFQITEGDTNNSYQTTEGDTNNSYQKTGGEWYCGLLKLTKYPKTTKLIEKAKYKWDLTIQELMLWCAENPKEVKKIRSEVKVRD